MMRSIRAFTFVEVLIVLALALVVLSLFETTAHGTRRTARSMQNNTQLRGIHQAMVMYAQGNGGYFPGLDARGNDAGTSVENRFHILLTNNYFTGEYAVSPHETKTAWTTGPITTEHYSFAMLQLPQGSGTLPAKPVDPRQIAARRAEWQETLNAEAIVMGDRNTGTLAEPPTVHGPGVRPGWGCVEHEVSWVGSIVFNDNHVTFERDPVFPTVYAGVAFPADHVYDPAGDDDAWLIYSGNEQAAGELP